MKKQYTAIESFVGIISMEKGQKKMLDAESIHTKDLLKAKLIEEDKPAKAKKPKKETAEK